MTAVRDPEGNHPGIDAAPLVGPDVDLRALDGFMLNVERLMASELVAISSGEEFKAAVLLWCRAWKQVPAASLPDDDRVLAAFAGCSLPRWRKLKAVALRGFVRCADGRLYHRVLAEDAIRAFARHQAFRARRAADQERLRDWRAKRVSERVAPRPSDASETERAQAASHRTGVERVKHGESTRRGPADAPAPRIEEDRTRGEYRSCAEPAAASGRFAHNGKSTAVDRFKAGALAALDSRAGPRPAERWNGNGHEPAAAPALALGADDP